MSVTGSTTDKKAKRRTESMPANMAEALKPVAGYSRSDGCQSERTCLIIWSARDTSSKGYNTRYPSNCHHGTHPMIFLFFAHLLFLHCSRHLLTSFLYDLAFPLLDESFMSLAMWVSV